jgi:acetylornithine deacetylase/succinyl-diaminopimelate desuccinylase-like protein
MSKLRSYYQQNGDRFVEGLKDLLRIPSISALPAHKADIRRAADFLVDDLKRMGIETVKLIEGDGNPIIYAEKMDAPGKPTVVIYGHYDVQPPDPMDEWVTPPFEPTLRGDDLFARGAVDDKGQMWILLKAVEGLLAVDGKLPVNVKFLIEGEEETSGGMIHKYLAEHGSELKADAALICDTEMFTKGLPTITTGVRGIIYTEIEVIAAKTDLHSGIYGGVAPNPMQAIAEVITGLKDKNGRILVPGFYDDIQAPSDAELDAWKQLPFNADEYRETEIGSTELTGEPGFSPIERLWARPALDVHGIRGGFIGDGAKTVIPAKALAKVSMRLVPNMNADKIAQSYLDHVKSLTPKGTVVKPRIMAASPAAVVSTDSPFVSTAAKALTETFNKETVYIRSGGSIPVVGLFANAGIPPVLVGFGLPDDNLHAPNEKFHLPNFHNGVQAIGRYLQMLGE